MAKTPWFSMTRTPKSRSFLWPPMPSILYGSTTFVISNLWISSFTFLLVFKPCFIDQSFYCNGFNWSCGCPNYRSSTNFHLKSWNIKIEVSPYNIYKFLSGCQKYRYCDLKYIPLVIICLSICKPIILPLLCMNTNFIRWILNSK